MSRAWDPTAPGAQGSVLDQLVYRSRLLAEDRSVCNWGGGNTSSKGTATDFRGRMVEVLHVKGSGSDMADAGPRNFATLLLEPVRELLHREELTDAAMVEYLAHCALNPGGPRPSIETLLHAFLPAPHVDHTHPDAIVALCTAAEGEAWAQELYGKRAIWIPYRRPGFALARQCALALAERPDADIILLAKHGLITWGPTAEASYTATLAAIAEADAFLRGRGASARPRQVGPLAGATEMLPELLPWLRGRLGQDARVVLSVDNSPAVLDFLADPARLAMAAQGAACPDHLVHTGRVPLIVPAVADPAEMEAALERALGEFAAATTAEFTACAGHPGTQPDGAAAPETAPTQDPPAPRVLLLPGLGMVTTGRTKLAADISRQLALRAMAVINLLAPAGASYAPLGAQDAFDVQYWQLERYKLTLQPPEREMSRQVALVTGGAGGIGRATARALCRAGAHVILADVDGPGASAAAQELCTEHGPGVAVGVCMDVTDEASLAAAFRQGVLEYGGIDLVIANAGIASSAKIAETSMAEWQRNMGVLATGYFLTAREGARVLRRQGLGGCILFVASKNAVAAGRNIAAYGAAKAAELHLARCLAEELGPDHIRVNVVNPDAVLSGSRIWSSDWKESRARNYGITTDDLPAYYRKRTLLDVNIQPEDVAEALLFLASRRAAKTTGAMLPVDGGVSGAFPR